MATPKLALIDVSALVHRAYHALPPMSTKAGMPTNAIYGFITMLQKVITTVKPTHMVAAFDVKGPTFRKKAFADYKAHRKKMADDLVPQLEGVRSVVKAFGIPMLSHQGFEADDIIGTLVEKIGASALKIIVTGDQDTFQLIDDTTRVFTLKRGVTDTILYDAALVREKFGFDVKFLPDYKGLRGDPSDNLPGVRGIGDKTARELIAQYGSIEHIYAHLDDIPVRARTKLEGQRETALLNRTLGTIRRDVPFDFDLAQAVFGTYDLQAVRAVFETFEFKSLVARLPQAQAEETPSLFKEEAEPSALPEHYHLVTTEDEQRQLRERLEAETIVAFDTETDGLGPRLFPIVGMSFAVKRGKTIDAWYVPMTPEALRPWKEFFENPAIKKVGHNIKYDMEVLLQSGIVLQGIVFDSMIANYLLKPQSRHHSLDAVAQEELSYTPIPLTHLIGQGKNQKKVSQVPLLDLARYAAEDAEVSYKLYEVLEPRIGDAGLRRVLYDLEVPLIPVLAALEMHGVKVDASKLKSLEQEVSKTIANLKKKIWSLAGEEFNINSTKQLRHILFEKLALPTHTIAKKQSGFSTAASELEKLRHEHALIPLLEEYRELSKLLSTYITTLPSLIDLRTQRLYSTFNQTIAATGRLSSTDPNLQNIPVKTPLGQSIRAAFVAEEGFTLIKADYSQFELRLVAHMSRDEKMMDTFRSGKDIHTATAAWIYGIPQDDVTPQQRREAKTINFGVLYGMGAQKFAREAGMSVERAKSFIGRYREQYSGITRFMEETVRHARETGFVETLFGRRRPVPELHARAPGIRAQAERIAFNFPIQGTQADILKKAMIELHQALAQQFPQARMVLTVHDELVVEAPTNEVSVVATLMKKIMEGAYTLDVPVVVEVAQGNNWRDMEPVTV